MSSEAREFFRVGLRCNHALAGKNDADRAWRQKIAHGEVTPHFTVQSAWTCPVKCEAISPGRLDPLALPRQNGKSFKNQRSKIGNHQSNK